MASIIDGFTYDIFISYRQKDNRGERWVSEFVGALEDELESAFKDAIDLYFDINPLTRICLKSEPWIAELLRQTSDKSWPNPVVSKDLISKAKY